jgi:hypothetical protein
VARGRGTAAGIAAVVLVAFVLPEADINDWPFLQRIGDGLLTGENPYRERVLVGPLALALYGVLGSYTLAALAGAVLLPLALTRIEGPARRRLLAVLVAAVPWCAAGSAGHLDDQVTTVLIVLALTTTGVASGAWLTLACAAKPFALLAVPVVDRRAAAVTVVSTLVGVCLLLMTLDGGWLASQSTTVQSGSPLSLVLPNSETPPSWWRLVQLSVLLVVATLAVRRVDPLRAVLVASSVRVALEPGDFVYYAAVLAGLAACLAVRDGKWGPLGLTWVVMLGVTAPAPAAVRLGALVVITLLCLREGRSDGADITSQADELSAKGRSAAPIGRFAWPGVRTPRQ